MPESGEEGYPIEFFDMAGNTVAVATLPASAVRQPTAADRPAVRNFLPEAPRPSSRPPQALDGAQPPLEEPRFQLARSGTPPLLQSRKRAEGASSVAHR